MAVDVPPEVAAVVEDFELGALVGRYPQAINRMLTLLCRVYAGMCGFAVLASVIGGATGGNLTAIPIVLPWLALSVWLVLLGERIKRNRAFYLYREGIVTTNRSGRVTLSERWENLQLYWEITRTGPNASGPLQDRYRLVVDDKTRFRHGNLRDFGYGRALRELAAAGRAPTLFRLLRSGKPVSFGPVTATTAGLVYRNKTLPWSTIDGIDFVEDMIANNAALISLRMTMNQPVSLPMSKVPDLLVLMRIVSSIKNDPDWLTQDA
jgi:hypothetical protein